jgi:ERF superfamily protein
MNTVIDMSKVNERRELAPVSEANALINAIERAARDPNVDIVKMKELFAMRKEIAAEIAETAFNNAMNACQAEMTPIATDAVNPQTRSKYATYGKLDGKLRPIYTRHGFSISFNEGKSEQPDHVLVLAYVSNAGYTRLYQADMPADGKGAKGGDVMTKTHAVGAAKSYGKRYLLKDIFNIAIGEEDTDGNAPSKDLPKPPEGYDTWKADMTALADEGTEALQNAWKKSSGMRGYAATFDAAWWASTKNKAAKASKVAQ